MGVVAPVFTVSVTCCRPFSITVCVEASAHVEPERGAILRGHPESPQRGGREAGDGDAEAGGEAASGPEHAAHRSRRGGDSPCVKSSRVMLDHQLSRLPIPQGVHPRRGGGVQTVAGLTRTYSGAAFPESCDQGGQGRQGGVASHDHHNVG